MPRSARGKALAPPGRCRHARGTPGRGHGKRGQWHRGWQATLGARCASPIHTQLPKIVPLGCRERQLLPGPGPGGASRFHQDQSSGPGGASGTRVTPAPLCFSCGRARAAGRWHRPNGALQGLVRRNIAPQGSVRRRRAAKGAGDARQPLWASAAPAPHPPAPGRDPGWGGWGQRRDASAPAGTILLLPPEKIRREEEQSPAQPMGASPVPGRGGGGRGHGSPVPRGNVTARARGRAPLEGPWRFRQAWEC